MNPISDFKDIGSACVFPYLLRIELDSRIRGNLIFVISEMIVSFSSEPNPVYYF